MSLLHDLNADGLTVVLITHDPSIAGAARRLVQLRDGRIVGAGCGARARAGGGGVMAARHALAAAVRQRPPRRRRAHRLRLGLVAHRRRRPPPRRPAPPSGAPALSDEQRAQFDEAARLPEAAGGGPPRGRPAGGRRPAADRPGGDPGVLEVPPAGRPSRHGRASRQLVVSARATTRRASIAAVRILVVDDEPAVRSALDRALRLERYDVRLAADGAEALAQLAEEPADAIVLDVAMPGHRRARGLPAPARGRRPHAGADAHRARDGRRPRRRPRRRRRRLPRQAVRAARAAGAAARAAAPDRRRARAAASCGSPTCGSTPPRARCTAASARSS